MSSTHSLLLQNIRSLRKNIAELQILIKSSKSQPSFLCLTETWLSDNHTNHLFKNDGYNEPLTCNRQKKGGCCYYFKEGSSDGTAQKTQNNNKQILTTKNSGAVAIYITAVYMKSNAPVNDSLIALENQPIDVYLQPDDINILCGDVNFDHSREPSRKTDLQNSLSCFGLQRLNSNKPTSETEQNSSVIDVYSNKKFQIETLETSNTNHYTLTVPRIAIGTHEEKETNRYRNWNLLENPESKEKLSFLTLIELQKSKKYLKHRIYTHALNILT